MSDRMKQLEEKLQLLEMEKEEKLKKIREEAQEKAKKEKEKLDGKAKQLLAQKQAILAREKEKERKERTKKLIKFGGLAEIAGLIGIDEGAVLGGLLKMAQQLKDKPEVFNAWKDTGDKILKERADARAVKKPGQN